MRKKVIAGNWKMNYNLQQSIAFIEKLKEEVLKKERNCDIIICPNFIALSEAKKIIKDTTIKLGAQNIYYEDSGAFTGETSADMIKSVGCEFVILGHSERRTIFKESDELINKKIKQALKHGLHPIFCIGETLEEREKGITNNIVERQLELGLSNVTPEELLKIIIAYEPVWAIGTGKNATPEQAQEVHSFIRNYLNVEYGLVVADKIIIQYGGSVKPENAKDLLSQPDIDGALVGGACLKVDSFIGIIESC
ncbi:MAG: triose-phosphate isomerase [Ignavibacterium sp.]|nr:triose-phosphate isomerase [Ignavibacterium sp.]